MQPRAARRKNALRKNERARARLRAVLASGRAGDAVTRMMMD